MSAGRSAFVRPGGENLKLGHPAPRTLLDTKAVAPAKHRLRGVEYLEADLDEEGQDRPSRNAAIPRSCVPVDVSRRSGPARIGGEGSRRDGGSGSFFRHSGLA